MLIDRDLLEKQFTKEQIKSRKGNFGKMIDYVDVQLIIQRLNDTFDALWSFKIIEHQILEDEVLVIGELYTSGISKHQFGSSAITRNASTGAIISLGDDLKAAASDSLKKCASMLGIALHVYGDSLPDQPPVKKKEQPPVEKKDQPPQGERDIPKEKEYDNFKTHRATYLASEIIKNMGDEERYQWNITYIKKASTNDWNMRDWNKAVDLARMQSDGMTFNDSATGEVIPDETERKELPELFGGISETNGGSKPATPAQLILIQKMLDEKGYFTKEDITIWNIGKAMTTIGYLKKVNYTHK